MSSTTEEIKRFIVAYIEDNASTDDASVSDDTDFVAAGLLDSFAILSLMMTLESEFAVKFKPDELASPAVRQVASLADTVAAKQVQ